MKLTKPQRRKLELSLVALLLANLTRIDWMGKNTIAFDLIAQFDFSDEKAGVVFEAIGQATQSGRANLFGVADELKSYAPDRNLTAIGGLVELMSLEAKGKRRHWEDWKSMAQRIASEAIRTSPTSRWMRGLRS